MCTFVGDMKHLVYILLGLMLVGVFSCRRSPGGTEARLVAIDSLITAKPDSALSLLADINADSLPADLRAYHDVLTTQALYKAYIPATTDTLIARAWSYYRDHGPYDRRIRAMLYSGTTAEELGHPDSAMRWYKRTELESRPDDHYHRAYAQECMGILYQKNFETRYAIDKYRSATELWLVEKDTINYLFCCQQLSQLYQKEEVKHRDSAFYYINIVKRVADEKNDSVYKTLAATTLAFRLYFDSCYVRTKNILVLAIRDYEPYVPTESWYYLSQCFCKLGMSDSAEQFLLTPTSTLDSAMYYHAKALICSSKGAWRDAHRYEVLSDSMSENMYLRAHNTPSLRTHEKDIEKEFSVYVAKKTNQSIINYLFYAIAAIIILAFVVVIRNIVIRKKTEHGLMEQMEWLEKHYKNAIIELQNKKETELLSAQEQLNQQIIENNKLQILRNDAEFIKNLYARLYIAFEQNIQPLGKLASDYYQNEKNAVTFMKRFSSHFTKLWDNNDMWNQIKEHINNTHNNCILKFQELYPKLSQEELHLVMLTALNFNAMAIAICLGYKSQNVVYSMRSKLKKKLKINCSIEEYIQNLEQSEKGI